MKFNEVCALYEHKREAGFDIYSVWTVYPVQEVAEEGSFWAWISYFRDLEILNLFSSF